MDKYQTITKEILDYLYENFPLAVESKPLPMNSSLYEAGILDSLGIIELVSFLEEKYNIKIEKNTKFYFVLFASQRRIKR